MPRSREPGSRAGWGWEDGRCLRLISPRSCDSGWINAADSQNHTQACHGLSLTCALHAHLILPYFLLGVVILQEWSSALPSQPHFALPGDSLNAAGCQHASSHPWRAAQTAKKCIWVQSRESNLGSATYPKSPWKNCLRSLRKSISSSIKWEKSSSLQCDCCVGQL